MNRAFAQSAAAGVLQAGCVPRALEELRRLASRVVQRTVPARRRLRPARANSQEARMRTRSCGDCSSVLAMLACGVLLGGAVGDCGAQLLKPDPSAKSK